MNAKTITTWIAQHRIRTALIALGVVLLAWDWFAIPRLIIMILLPLVLLLLPLLLFAAPVVVLVLFLRRRARAQQAVQGYAPNVQGYAPNVQATPQDYPEAAPQRRLSAQEVADLYERHPERFESVDLGDEFDR